MCYFFKNTIDGDENITLLEELDWVHVEITNFHQNKGSNVTKNDIEEFLNLLRKRFNFGTSIIAKNIGKTFSIFCTTGIKRINVEFLKRDMRSNKGIKEKVFSQQRDIIINEQEEILKYSAMPEVVEKTGITAVHSIPLLKYQGILEITLNNTHQKRTFTEQDRILNKFIACFIDLQLFIHLENQQKKNYLLQAESISKNARNYQHELLNLIQINTVTLEKFKSYPNDLDIDKIVKNLQTMNTLVKNSRKFCLGDFIRTIIDVKKVEIDLCEIISYIKDLWEDKAHEKGCKFELDIPKEVIFKSTWELLRLIFQNLISNAVKYSVINSLIIIKIIELESMIEVSIINKVKRHLKEEELDQIFESSSRVIMDKQLRGEGLGLSISKSIIENSHGLIFADYYKKTKQFVITVRLPKN